MTQELYELPEGWEWKRLDEIAEFGNGYAFKSSEFSAEGIPVLRISNIQDGKISHQNMAYITKDKLNKNADRFYIEPNDIVIAMSGATTGKIALNNTNQRLLQNQRVGRIATSNEVLRRYLYYFLGSRVEENLRRSLGAA